MLQLSADLFTLSLSQRQAIADFILNFPSQDSPSAVDVEEDEETVNIPAFAIIPEEAFALTDGPTLATNVAPAPTPLAFATDTGLDSAGLPWDERIHSGNRAKVADGTWRKRRGVSDAEVATVEAQLKQFMALPSPATAVAPPPPSAPLNVPADEAPMAQMVVAAGIAPPPPPAPAAAPDKAMYMALIDRGSKAVAEKKLTQEEFNFAVTSVGVPTLGALIHRLDLVPQVMNAINTFIASRP